MRGRRLIALGLGVAAAAATAATLLATSVTVSGVTLTYPDYAVTGPALESCEPWEEATAKEITLTGVPIGSSITVQFSWSAATGGTITNATPISITATDPLPIAVPVSYPSESSLWPVYNTVTNERSIAIAVAVRIITPSGLLIKLNSKKWWIRCLPPVNPPNTGCTLGYWKQEQHFDSWVGYSPADDYNAIFGVTPTNLNPHTMLDALEAGGGGQLALARQSAAALLSASNSLITYPLTPAQIIAGVQAAYSSGDYEPFKDLLDAYNNAGCPLN